MMDRKEAWMVAQAEKADAAISRVIHLDQTSLMALLAYLCGRAPQMVEDGVDEVARVRTERGL